MESDDATNNILLTVALWFLGKLVWLLMHSWSVKINCLNNNLHKWNFFDITFPTVFESTMIKIFWLTSSFLQFGTTSECKKTDAQKPAPMSALSKLMSSTGQSVIPPLENIVSMWACLFLQLQRQSVVALHSSMQGLLCLLIKLHPIIVTFPAFRICDAKSEEKSEVSAYACLTHMKQWHTFTVDLSWLTKACSEAWCPGQPRHHAWAGLVRFQLYDWGQSLLKPQPFTMQYVPVSRGNQYLQQDASPCNINMLVKCKNSIKSFKAFIDKLGQWNFLKLMKCTTIYATSVGWIWFYIYNVFH